MARKKTQKKALPRHSSLIEKNKRALVIGTIVVAALGILTAQSLQNKGNNKEVFPTPIELPKELTVKNDQKATASASITAKPATASATPAVKAEKESTPSAKAVIKKLPNTASETIYYTVKKGDSVARIGNRVCGNKQAWTYIAEDNNLSYPYTLQVGEIIAVNCK